MVKKIRLNKITCKHCGCVDLFMHFKIWFEILLDIFKNIMWDINYLLNHTNLSDMRSPCELDLSSNYLVGDLWLIEIFMILGGFYLLKKVLI